MTNRVVYGVTKEGFKRKRLPEIMSNMFDRFEDTTGVKVNREPDSVLAMLLHVIGYEVADLWTDAEDTYNAMYPHTAIGKALNDSAMLAGVIPRMAKATEVYITCYGDEGTVIPANSTIASNTDGSITYSAVNSGVITMGNANHATVRLTRPAGVGDIFTLRINGVSSTYTSVANDTENTILMNLYTKLQNSGVQFNLTDEGLLIATEVASKGVPIIVSDTLQVNHIASPILFACNTDGSITPLSEDLTSIINGVDGWTYCTNEAPAIVGRSSETDEEIRIRWNSDLYRRGSANTDAIRGHILNNVNGVTTCRVFENVSNEVDTEGRPPHSIEAVISGGNSVDIANEIWRAKGAGIDTHGSVAVDVTDSQGVVHTMHFNRPIPVKVWLRITIERLDELEWSHSNRMRVMESVLNKARQLDLGEDVVLQRFIGDIYKNTSGVGMVRVEACTGDIPSAYTTSNISIGVREVAEIVEERIEVVEHV